MDESHDLLKQIIAEVPEKWHARFLEIVAIIDRFCDEHLDDEYMDLARDMAACVCIDGSPATRGKAASWAAAIVWTVGWVNFLSDSSFEPTMMCKEVAAGFGVSESNMSRLSGQLRDVLDLIQMHPGWTLPSRLADNPLAWMLETSNGIIIDARMLPREQQEELAKAGIIPDVVVAADSPDLRLASP